ncbi:MAG: nicotinate (nicotinamide) nucleotide adenylyltransferase [Ruminococcaceae bacterium]|nr:nicotinate (nicotinamide) nucleotide adenylyltransferase [Oscillospiraceae bacterium]
MPRKIGIYGGTFSPPHIGHISAAKAFYDEIKPDTLLIMPTFTPPHKIAYTIDPIHRMNMAKLAFSDKEGFSDTVKVSDFELNKKNVSYTYETLEHFASPDVKLYFLCGTDMFLTLDKWRNPEIIFDLAVIVLALREDTTDEISEKIALAKDLYEKNYGAEIIILKNKPITVSSSEVRLAVSSGENASAFITGPVYDYIKNNKLYSD